MKTARQILLERHASSTPYLDALRRNVIGRLSTPPEPWWQVAWREIVVAARPAWVALAALAVVAIGLNLSALGPRPFAKEPAPWAHADPTAAREARAEKTRLWADLREGPTPPPTPPTAPRSPKTSPNRSQISNNLWPV